MPYTPNALDDTQPTQAGSKARYTAEELRAIKTLLKSHEQAITTTLPASVADVAADVAALAAKLPTLLTLVQLAGSGNFTVPAGVTKLYVVAVGGGQSGCTVAPTATGQTLCWYPPSQGKSLVQALSVTAGQNIAYSVGANGVPAVTYEIGPAAVMRSAVAAAATAFGSVSTGVPYIEPVRFGEQHSVGTDWVLNGIVPTYDTYNTAVLERTKSAIPNYPLPKLVFTVYNAFNVTITPPETTPILLIGW